VRDFGRLLAKGLQETSQLSWAVESSESVINFGLAAESESDSARES